MIKKIDTVDGLAEIAHTWRELYASNPQSRIFQSYEWCKSSWDDVLNDGASSLYVLVWQQENLDDCVIFPFYLDGQGTLRFIMDEHSDYCDCIYSLDRNHHLAYREALDSLCHDKRIRRIELHKLDPDSEALNYLGVLAVNSHIAQENAYSWISVAPCEDFASFQKQLRSKDKANVRAIRRKSDCYKMCVYSRMNGIEYPAAMIDTLVERMKSAARRSGDFMPESMKRFCREIYEKDIADIVGLIDAENTPVALNFILKKGGRRLSWIFLYSDPHASTELYVKLFYSDVFKEPILFDFGTGGYEYKLGTFRPCMRLLFGLSVELRKSDKIRIAFRRMVRETKDFVKVIIGRI